MTPELPEALQVALKVIDVLGRLGIRYHLGGSYASSLHGFPRQTQDIDLVVDLKSDVVSAFATQLAADFYIDEETIRRALRDSSSFNLVHLKSGIKVDLFILGDHDFDRQEFKRHRLEVVQVDPERRVFVKSPEDIVLRKLQWYRQGGEVSDRQWTDLLAVIRIQGERLDLEYLSQWAERLELSDLLERALQTES
jgi:hypothetical protein